MLTAGVQPQSDGDREQRPRDQQEAVGNHIIQKAKENGLYIPESERTSFGEQIIGFTGESVVYYDEANNRVVKVKDPFAKAETFDDLFRIANEVLTSNNKTNGNEVLRANGSPVIPGIDKPSGKARGERHSGQPDATDGNGRNGGTGTPVRGGSEGGNRKDGQGSVSGTPDGSGKVSGQRTGVSDIPGKQPSVSGNGTTPDRGSSTGRGGTAVDGEGSRGTSSGSTGRVQSVGNGDVPAGERGKRVEQPQEQRKLDQEKLSYRPHNGAFSLESVSPAAMVESMDASLSEDFADSPEFSNFAATIKSYIQNGEKRQKGLGRPSRQSSIYGGESETSPGRSPEATRRTRKTEEGARSKYLMPI